MNRLVGSLKCFAEVPRLAHLGPVADLDALLPKARSWIEPNGPVLCGLLRLQAVQIRTER